MNLFYFGANGLYSIQNLFFCANGPCPISRVTLFHSRSINPKRTPSSTVRTLITTNVRFHRAVSDSTVVLGRAITVWYYVTSNYICTKNFFKKIAHKTRIHVTAMCGRKERKHFIIIYIKQSVIMIFGKSFNGFLQQVERFKKNVL